MKTIVTDKAIVTGVLNDTQRTRVLLAESFAKSGGDAWSAIGPRSNPFAENCRVIAAFDEELTTIICCVQIVHVDVLFGDSMAIACRYWGHDEFLTSNVLEMVLAHACYESVTAWRAVEIQTILTTEEPVHSFIRMGAELVKTRDNAYRATLKTGGLPFPVSKHELRRGLAVLDPSLFTRWKSFTLVRYA